MNVVPRLRAWRTNEHETLQRREAKYRALADLFAAPGRATIAAIPVLALPCVPGVLCPVCQRPLALAADRARTWCQTDTDIARLVLEYRRLFGGESARAAVSPYASSYTPDTGQSIRDAVSGYYQRLDFPGRGHDLADDPRHISSQLGFMAHCLELERCGLGPRVDGALFFGDQLLPWAPMFARATEAATREPVLGFAALALEQFLKCESMLMLSDAAEP